MGRQRMDLDAIFRSIAPNVYFQPPENLKLTYPCIIYSRDYTIKRAADNGAYAIHKRYLVTVIDRSPDSALFDKVLWLPQCQHLRSFTKDQLNHSVYNLFY